MSVQRHLDILETFHEKRILVIGDLILDVYLKGTSTRLSPEAPVPVVDVAEKKAMLGGAGNTVCNLRTLGAHVDFCSVVGEDAEGDLAIQLLASIGISPGTIVRDPSRSTLVKTRVLSGQQILTRFDTGTPNAIDDNTAHTLLYSIRQRYGDYDAVVLSDYNKGVITTALRDELKQRQQRHKKFLAVDSKRLPFFKSLHPSMVKPNYEEAMVLLGYEANSPDRVGQLAPEGENFYGKTGASIVAVTMDHDGAMFFEQGHLVHQCDAAPVANPHVAGAGDTFLSAFVLSHCSTDDIAMSATLAIAAATVAIRKESTSSCSQEELRAWFSPENKLVQSLDDLRRLADHYRSQGKRIVFTNGCFDILHSGHVTYLHCARTLGDVLFVGINTDESIRRLKGESRPINPLADRIEVLSGLMSTDHIISFGNERDDTPIALIEAVRPDVFVKGGDYTRDRLPEARAVEASGGKIVFIPHVPDHSTSLIIERVASGSTPQPLSVA